MRIDIHTHPIFTVAGETWTTEERFLKEMDAAGIDKAALLAVDTIPEQFDAAFNDWYFCSLYRKAYKQEREDTEMSLSEFREYNRSFMHLGATNEKVRRLCAKYPGRFIGFGSVNPRRSRKEVIKSIDRFVADGFKGLKLMPTLQFFHPHDKAVDIIYRRAAEQALAVLFHTGCDPGAWEYPPLSEGANPAHLDLVAQRYPGLTIIAAHMGSYSRHHPGLWFEEMMTVMERNSNIYADISALRKETLFGKTRLLERAIERVGVERILFGSDYPAVDHYPIRAAARTIDESGIAGAELIMGGNAARILRLE
jgi:hypothetical protein